MFRSKILNLISKEIGMILVLGDMSGVTLLADDVPSRCREASSVVP